MRGGKVKHLLNRIDANVEEKRGGFGHLQEPSIGDTGNIQSTACFLVLPLIVSL
jgi:hypothetical protein